MCPECRQSTTRSPSIAAYMNKWNETQTLLQRHGHGQATGQVTLLEMEKCMKEFSLQSTSTHIHFSWIKEKFMEHHHMEHFKRADFFSQADFPKAGVNETQKWMLLRTSETGSCWALHISLPSLRTQVLAWSSIYSEPQGLPTQLSISISLGTRWLVTWVLKGTS